MAVEFLVALPVDPMKVGDVYPRGAPIPLHCALMQWFWIQNEKRVARLHNELTVLAANTSAGGIELVSETPALLGAGKNILVGVLKQNDRLNLLHTKLLIFLAEYGSAPAAHPWVGAGYRPHVARSAVAFVEGSRHIAERLVLIERDREKTWQVRCAYTFGGTPLLY